MIYDIEKKYLGKIYWILIKPIDLYKLLPEYGRYAHGTHKINGKITLESINNSNNNFEYSLRPNPNKNGKSKKLWNELVKYKKSEEEINKLLNE